jgi:hypothetical protein
MKTAVTALSASIVTVHGSAVQAPSQWSNRLPGSGVAVSVTMVPSGNGAEHVAGQLIPAGSLVTVPVPVPLSKSTASVKSVADAIGPALAGAGEPKVAPIPDAGRSASTKTPRAMPTATPVTRARSLRRRRLTEDVVHHPAANGDPDRVLPAQRPVQRPDVLTR